LNACNGAGFAVGKVSNANSSDAVVGINWIVKVPVEPAVIVAGVTEPIAVKSEAFGPEIEGVPGVQSILPVFVIVTVKFCDWPCVTVPGCPVAVVVTPPPMPPRATVIGVTPGPPLIVSVAEASCKSVGVNVTVIVCIPPGGTVGVVGVTSV